MLRKFLLACSLPLCLVAQNIRIIDFEQAKPVPKVKKEQSWVLGYEAFNHSPELIPFFKLLQSEYQIPVAIETGTFQGNTTVFLARVYSQVHTVELFPLEYENAKRNLSCFSNVQCHLGDSARALNLILPEHRSQKVFFYLDAHGQSDWPLLGELDAISKTHRDDCIIAVDDFKVPNRPDIPYDSYNDIDCCYEYIREGLSKVFSDYECCIVIPKHKGWRAKFVAFPKKWGTKALRRMGYFQD